MPSRVLFACAVSAAILYAQPQPPIRSWADADKIEADLQSRPDDLNLRVQLLRYYTQQGVQSAGRVKPLRRKHVLWMVENHPEHSVLSEWAGALDPSGHELADAEGYAACSAAWQKALGAAKPLFDTFGNAIYFYKTADPARARQIAEDGLKLYPGNARILQRKGMLLAHTILGVKSVDQFGRGVSFDDVAAAGAQAVRDRKTLEASDDPNLLSGAAAALTGQIMALRNRADRLAALEELVTLLYRRADEADPNMGRWKTALTAAYQSFAAASDAPREKIRYLEKGLALAPNPPMRRTVLPELAQQYLIQGSTAKAAEAANELLSPDQDKSDWNYGNAIFAGNTVVGRIALQKGDTKEAAQRLLAAGRAPSTPQLSSFGPQDWHLAEGLLAAGDRESVLAYLDLVRAFWKNDNGRLNTWMAAIRRGETPNFGGVTAFPRERFVGRAAPELRLKDLKGVEVTLADFKGKVVLLDFWATWCPPCRAEMPDFQTIHQELSGNDVAVLTVDVDEPLETPVEYMEKEKFTFPVLLARDTDTVKRYGVSAYPTTFVIDGKGLVADVIVGGGSNSGARLQSLIEKGHAGAPAAAPLPARATPPPPAPATTAEDLYRDAVRQRNEKDYAAANRSLTRALELRPDWLLAVIARASNYASERKFDEAIAGYGRAIQIDPKRAASYDSRGLAYSNSGRHTEAIPDYTRAIELNPDLVVAHNNRGWAYMETGHPDEALTDLNRAIELSPTYTTALFNRAHLFERRTEIAKAIADYDSILRIEPGNASASGQREVDVRRLQAAAAPAATAAAGPLVAPRLLSPADGVVFEHFPRETTVVWAAVPGASAYTVEWDYRDDQGWASERSGALARVETKEPVATFRFVGAQPGRWRVWAADPSGVEGSKSDWRGFRYTR